MICPSCEAFINEENPAFCPRCGVRFASGVFDEPQSAEQLPSQPQADSTKPIAVTPFSSPPTEKIISPIEQRLKAIEEKLGLYGEKAEQAHQTIRYICSSCGGPATSEDFKAFKMCNKCAHKAYELEELNESPHLYAETAAPSNAWYLAPILLGIIGGLIGFFSLKRENLEMATTLLVVGVGITVLVYFILAFH